MMAKNYALDQSPLYKIVGLGQLQKILQIDLQNLSRLLSPENYHVWLNERGREIQQPIRWLAQVHKRLSQLLSRIDLPDYVHSKKGRSYISNARQHCNPHPLGKTDITRFYTSTTRTMVRRMFRNLFKCAGDVADILADICCYRQAHLPTGSSLSGRIAFFAALPMFNEIDRLALSANGKMTVYVDDITISGPSVTKKLMADACKIIHCHGLKTKKSKTQTFPKNSIKSVTGVTVYKERVCLPNSRHKRIWETRRMIKDASLSERLDLQRSLRGRLQEAKQIESANGLP